MKRILFIFVVAVLSFFAWGRASATTCTVPNTFSNGTVADANQVNANFAALQSCGNNIDYRNIGVAGLYASQLLPGTTAQATFGGLYGYSFGGYSTTQVPLTLYGVASQTGDLLDILLAVGGTKVAWVDSGGILHLLYAPAMSGASITSGTIPDAALVTAPVTSVTASGNVTSTGGTTPLIGFSSTPSFTSITATNGMTAGSSTYGPTSAVVNGTLTAGTGSGGVDAIHITDSCTGGTLNLFTSTSAFSVQGILPTALGFFCGVPSFAMDTGGDLGVYGNVKAGSFLAGSSTYGPTSATVNGPLTITGAGIIDNSGSGSLRFHNATINGFQFVNSALSAVIFGLDNAGNGTFSGSVNNQPTGATVVGPAGACYTAAGAACAGSFHRVIGTISLTLSGSCAALSTCSPSATVSFSGSAIFSSSTSGACAVSNTTTNSVLGNPFLGSSGANITLYAFNYGASTLASGTVTNFSFVCSGT